MDPKRRWDGYAWAVAAARGMPASGVASRDASLRIPSRAEIRLAVRSVSRAPERGVYKLFLTIRYLFKPLSDQFARAFR